MTDTFLTIAYKQ